jgi:DNA-binding CsgD family transcriptional regulator
MVQLLETVATATGVPGVELDLCLESKTARTYSYGVMHGRATTSLELAVDGFEATLRLASSVPPAAQVTRMVALTLDKILRCHRYQEQVSLLRGALDTTSSAVLLFDDTGGIVYVNPPADSLLARQTEDGLAVEVSAGRHVPLVSHLCSKVESINAKGAPHDPWTGTLTLSDGSTLACEILKVNTGGQAPSSGVLALLQPVPALSRLCMESFCARHHLSPREVDVVRLLLEGLTTNAMADRLSISLHTVRDHFKRLYRKTGVRSRSELLSLLSTAGSPPAMDSSQGKTGRQTDY